MNKQCIRALKEDFMEWSGGFPPESEEQIFVYVELVGPVGSDEDQVRTMLREWMNQPEIALRDENRTTAGGIRLPDSCSR